MKTLKFGLLMGFFGAIAVYVSITFGWKAWVLFLAWVCFYIYEKNTLKLINVYLQIVLGIFLSILIELLGNFLINIFGEIGLYISIFLLISSLAFLVKIKGLNDLTAWFFGLIVFFGIEPKIHIYDIFHLLLIPLALGFALGYLVDKIVSKYIFKHH